MGDAVPAKPSKHGIDPSRRAAAKAVGGWCQKLSIHERRCQKAEFTSGSFLLKNPGIANWLEGVKTTSMSSKGWANVDEKRGS